MESVEERGGEEGKRTGSYFGSVDIRLGLGFPSACSYPSNPFFLATTGNTTYKRIQ